MKSLRLIPTAAAASLALCAALNAPAFAADAIRPSPRPLLPPAGTAVIPFRAKSAPPPRDSATLSEWAINALIAKPTDALIAKPTDADPLAALTQRERPVLPLAAEGHSNPEVAEKLLISPRTAETHRTNLLRKLRLQTQTDLVRFAIRKGLITA